MFDLREDGRRDNFVEVIVPVFVEMVPGYANLATVKYTGLEAKEAMLTHVISELVGEFSFFPHDVGSSLYVVKDHTLG